MATLADIAKLAGVSISTVSRVLNKEMCIRDSHMIGIRYHLEVFCK